MLRTKFVNRDREARTEFCPDVAGFCPGVSRFLSLCDRSLSWSAVNNMWETFCMSSVCSSENPVKSGGDSGAVASEVSGVPVHADLPRARARGEQHTIREGRFKGSLCSKYG